MVCRACGPCMPTTVLTFCSPPHRWKLLRQLEIWLSTLPPQGESISSYPNHPIYLPVFFLSKSLKCCEQRHLKIAFFEVKCSPQQQNNNNPGLMHQTLSTLAHSPWTPAFLSTVIKGTLKLIQVLAGFFKVQWSVLLKCQKTLSGLLQRPDHLLHMEHLLGTSMTSALSKGLIVSARRSGCLFFTEASGS